MPTATVLAAEVLFALLINEDDAFAGVGNLRRGDKARQSAADHDYVCIARHRIVSPRFRGIEARRVNRGQRQTAS